MLDKRASKIHKWIFRFKDANGKYRGITFADTKQCSTESQARIEADRQRLPEKYILPAQAAREGRKTFAQLIAEYKEEVMPDRFSTKRGYTSWLDLHIAPKWENEFIEDVKPGLVELWFKDLPLSGKSKSHIKGIMTALFNYAMKWEWIALAANPMRLVTVRGVKRKARPQVLTPEQFLKFYGEIQDYHVRVIDFLCMCLGLRLSEVLAPKWLDVNWKDGSMFIRRGIVAGREGDVKTEYSEAPAPLAPELIEMLKSWRKHTEFKKEDDWIFASPFQAGEKPYFPTAIQRKNHAAAKRAGLAELFAGEPTKILRHSYRSWLGTTGAPIGVIKDLMRHADVRTTMNVYGNGLQPAMREAHSKVVQMVAKKRA
jgi:integrase